MTTVFAEGLLALCCLSGALLLWRSLGNSGNAYGALALVLVGVAAALGAIKFGTDLPVTHWHGWASAAARMAAMPLMAVAWLIGVARWPRGSGARLVLLLVVLAPIAVHWSIQPLDWYVQWAPKLAFAVVFLVALLSLLRNRDHSLLALAALGQLVMADTVIGTVGSINGWLALDLFHFLLASGWLSLAVALRNSY